MSFAPRLFHAAAVLVAAAFCQGTLAQAPAQTPAPAAAQSATPAATSGGETGLAAVYNDRLNHHKTGSGKCYNRNQLTAAHKTLPFGTRVKVANAKNNDAVIVTINDRGPIQAGRILDLSSRAAKALGIGPKAMVEVSTEVVDEAPVKTKKG